MTLQQGHYRFRTDGNAVDSTPTWGADEDAAFDPGGDPFRLRFGIDNSGNAVSGEFELYVQKNSGAYGAVTTSSMDGLRSFDASSDADDTKILIPRLSLVPGISSVLLLHMNGTDGSTTFADATGRHEVTAVGNAQIDTAESKFGGASGYFASGEGWLTLDGSSDFAFSTGDFTIDFQLMLSATDIWQVLYDCRETGINGFFIAVSSANKIYFESLAGSITGTANLNSGNWYHVELTRSGTSTRLFFDGTQEGSTLSDSQDYGIAAANAPTIGKAYTALFPMSGHLDEFRIIKGYAAHTSNFTPPTDEYTA